MKDNKNLKENKISNVFMNPRNQKEKRLESKKTKKK